VKKLLLEHEGTDYSLVNRDYEEFHGVSLAAISMNEEKNIVDFLKHIRPAVRSIALIDGNSKDKTVELAEPLVDTLKIFPFKGHFGNQKNRVIELCYTDWVLLLDPDERLSKELIDKIPEFIEQDEYDCFSIPRREFMDGKEVEGIYPDYQDRLFRSYCRFVRPVHEELVGYHKKKIVEAGKGLDIAHLKEKERHIVRNTSYMHFERHYMHEMGAPGAQEKKKFLEKYKELFNLFKPEGK